MLAQKEAHEARDTEVGSEHVLLGVLLGEELQYSVNSTQCKTIVQNQSSRRKRDAGMSIEAHELPFSRNAKAIFESASLESKTMAMNFISPEHIILAVLKSGNTGAMDVLKRLNANTEALTAEANRRLKGGRQGTVQKKTPAARSKQGTKALEQFCRDLTAQAAQGKIDPVIGREQEIYRTCQILARRKKNNPILLGEPGVGKTAIAEGLAHCIATNGSINGAPLPSVLKGVRILQLDVGLLLAGAKERGELESRVTKLLAECKASRGQVLLAIDEIHTLVGAGSVSRGGSGGGGLDVSNLIKPALAAGDLQCIGSTTLDEHRAHIESDPALERRFQPVLVREPSVDEAVLILQGLQSRYEQHHRCSYTAAAIQSAVTLAARYIPDRYLPDKAIDLMDEAGSRARITSHFARADVDLTDVQQYHELLQVMDAKEDAIRSCLFEEASLLRERELDLKSRLVAPPAMATAISLVDTPDIEKIVAMWTDIPVERMTSSEADRLLNLPAQLQSRVVGQSHAVETVSLALQRARAGLKDPARPIASLLFSGPTGVGKTCLSVEIAQHFFGTADALVRFDMSEYMERHSLSTLIGAPPGYIGYGEGGVLTEAVRRRPFCLLLFDEIEKAHPDIFNALLQIIEDGRLTDSKGRVVSFKHCLIVMTSNVGSRAIARGGSGLGFQLAAAEDVAGQQAHMRSLVMDELKGFFRPEFLNRIDSIVVFNQLRDEHVRSIADKLIEETVARVRELGVHMEVSEPAMALICSHGFDIDQGARRLRRAITSLVEDKLSDVLLSDDVRAGDSIVVDVQAGNIVVLHADQLDARSASQGADVPGFLLANEVVETPVVVNATA